MEKHYTDMTFEELVDFHMRQIHMGLLEDGSKGMHAAVTMVTMQTLQWHAKRDQEKAKTQAAEAATEL